MQFAVYISDTPVTLKQSQGHQTYNENGDPKQTYDQVKFQRSCFNCVQEKANVKSFFQTRKYVNYLPWTCAKVKKKKIVVSYDLLNIVNNCTKFQHNLIKTYIFQFKVFDTAVTLKYN